MLRSVLSLILAAALILCLGWSPAHAQATPPAGENTPASPQSPTLVTPLTPVPSPSLTPGPETAILNPLPGQALQGNVTVSGRMPSSSFQAAELDFGYTGDPTGTWFLIAQFAAPVANGLLAQWDTTTLSDGVYTLRLLVNQGDGSLQEIRVAGVRVRNYSAIETDTPTPILPTATPQPGNTLQPTATRTAAPTQTRVPATATSLPPNPGILSTAQIGTSLGRGALGTAGFFALLGLYAALRRLFKPR